MAFQNPFRYNQPAAPELFVDRWPLVECIVGDLIQFTCDSWAVIGGKRFGKSSVLQAIEYRLQEYHRQCQSGERLVLPVLMDLKRCQPESEQHIYACIVRYLYRALRRFVIPGFDPSVTRLNTAVIGGNTSLSFFDFEDILDDLALCIEKTWGAARLVFLLDEVEAMTCYDWSETFFNQLRALIYAGPLANTVKIVLTGAANVIRVKHAGSPLLNAVKIEHLAALDTSAMQELVARGNPISDAVVNAIIEQSGGHPFIAQYLLHHLWNDGLAQAKPDDVTAMVHHLYHNRAADLQGWWEAIGDSGRWAYAALVASGDWMHESDLLQVTQGTTQPLDQGLAALCYHGLVVRHSDWVHYRVAGQLFADWFRFRAEQHLAEAKGNLDSAQLPPETRIYQTVIHGNVNGPVALGGEAIDQREAQGPVYKPRDTVEQNFNTQGDSEND